MNERLNLTNHLVYGEYLDSDYFVTYSVRLEGGGSLERIIRHPDLESLKLMIEQMNSSEGLFKVWSAVRTDNYARGYATTVVYCPTKGWIM